MHKNGVHASYVHSMYHPTEPRLELLHRRKGHLYISGYFTLSIENRLLTPLSAILLLHRRCHQCRWHHSYGVYGGIYVTITFAICLHIHTYVLRLTFYFSTFLPVSILAPEILCMVESNEHHVTFNISYQTQRYNLPANPRKNTDNYNGAITLLHETFVFDDEYVDTRIWTTGSAYRSMYVHNCTHVTEDLKLCMGQ